MKKDFIFLPTLSIIAMLLSFLKFTGMTAHIIISIVGAVVLVAYTVLTKKEWKMPMLEILTRAFYGIALITGIIIKSVHGITALVLIHKISSLLFVVGILTLLIIKAVKTKKA